MKALFSFFFLLISLCFVWQCQRKQVETINMQTNQSEVEIDTGLAKLDSIVQDYFGKEYELSWNKGKTAVIVKKLVNTSKHQPQGTLHFLIFDLGKEKIIFKDAIPKGAIEWLSEEVVKITSIPGRIQRGSTEIGYLYDITIGQKKQL